MLGGDADMRVVDRGIPWCGCRVLRGDGPTGNPSMFGASIWIELLCLKDYRLEW